MRLRRVFRDGCGNFASLAFVVLLCVLTATGQGAAPETAPPLFPGGGLISYNSIFTTRGLTSGSSAKIPATSLPLRLRSTRGTSTSRGASPSQFRF